MFWKLYKLHVKKSIPNRKQLSVKAEFVKLVPLKGVIKLSIFLHEGLDLNLSVSNEIYSFSGSILKLKVMALVSF